MRVPLLGVETAPYRSCPACQATRVVPGSGQEKLHAEIEEKFRRRRNCWCDSEGLGHACRTRQYQQRLDAFATG